MTHNTTNMVLRVMFMAPVNPNQEIELNSAADRIIFGDLHIQPGWRVEAHHEQLFFLHIVFDSILLTHENGNASNIESNQASTTIIRKIRHNKLNSSSFSNNLSDYMSSMNRDFWPTALQFYIYFTSDPNSCDDYLEHTHTPLIVDSFYQIRPGLFKIPISFSLSHSSQPYFLCLSEAYFETSFTGKLVLSKLFSNYSEF